MLSFWLDNLLPRPRPTGHDPFTCIKEVVAADGDIMMPVGGESFGLCLKAAFGGRRWLFFHVHKRRGVTGPLQHIG